MTDIGLVELELAVFLECNCLMSSFLFASCYNVMSSFTSILCLDKKAKRSKMSTKIQYIFRLRLSLVHFKP